MNHSLFQITRTVVVLGCAAASVSCTRIGNFAEKRADRAAYGNIRGAQNSALGKCTGFSIDNAESQRLRELLEHDRNAEKPELLSLSDALAVAMVNSRSYQTRKEGLFIEALNLTEVQKDFNWNFSSAHVEASSEWSKDRDGNVETFGDNGMDGTGFLQLQKTLASGARITLDFTQNLTAYFTDPDASDESSVLSFNVVQPLLNGAGPLVTEEPLRQAERDMIYEVRKFKRYQQDFVIDIAAQYYSTLRTRDALENALKNYESSIANREQTESYAKAGRIADFEAAQARQSELNAADRWTLARSNFQKALDDFRFNLGLPVDLNVEPDTNELARLEVQGLVDLDISLDRAIESAVSNRLDLITGQERVEDKERKVEIQRRNFLPNLDLTYDVDKSFDSNTGQDYDQTLKARLELPFDWTEKRNAYRIAQINLDREVRSHEEGVSDVRRDVRDLWRKLERNRSVYTNRLLSVKLAERRVEQTTLLLKQGKALTRDLLDAEDDLLSSRNEATAALVDYTINRLRFWNAIERFEIDPKGMWYELADD